MDVANYFDAMSYEPSFESDTEARAWLSARGGRFDHFIGGEPFAPTGGGYFETFEPATGKVLASVAQGGLEDVEAAVAAALRAQAGWARLSGHARARHMYALARTIQRHARLIAVIEALDNGKPIREARDLDIPLAVRHFYHHAGWAQLQDSEFSGYAPLGVIGQIVPWNFPFLMLAWKVAPAIALGNAVVLKPAEATPLTALLFAELARQAGLPPGVLNVVTGEGTTGGLLVDHPDVAKIAFTGSTEVGRLIRQTTAGAGKSLTLELGGKSPFIVFEDADLDSAIEGVVDAIWLNQGQVCCAGSRLLVQEGVAEAFLERLKRRMATLRVGPSLDKTIDMGPVIDAGQLRRIERLVATGVAEGAVCHQAEMGASVGGLFYPPTLLTGVQPASTVAQEEIFGPVLVATTFRTPDEAVMLANNTRFGLAASIWSESIGLALDVAARVQAGVVWVNAANLFDASVGFGGVRESGFGREGGREGAFEYLKPVAWSGRAKRRETPHVRAEAGAAPQSAGAIDRTAKNYIGGKQTRTDSGYSRAVLSAKGRLVGEVGVGNRKDIRDAVAAARGAGAWASASAHQRSQVLYYLAENLSVRTAEFASRIETLTGVSPAKAGAEVNAAVARLFAYGAWADKFEGAVHVPPLRGVALAINEPIGVVGVVCPDEAPLLALISLVAPLISMGNRVVVAPSARAPLVATDFYQILETSDVPPGVVNIVTGDPEDLARTLARHNDVDGLWAFGSKAMASEVERLSTGNLKRTLVDDGLQTDWLSAAAAEGRHFLRHAVQVKNIWIPYGSG
ncbi:aldehyde dehydrogenase family protein [Phenylobacterium sp. LH3H17]|uniref:aldehyde dehydrogenase family protein n=1 Tax=Phenylobacterium sp. LH3H17 TaxID=2903901 RepID=UPI0020C9A273|nr:aldehyde dehydrogenase family protein [Phenylobacterium sp. LH3H17]UTP38306.1 aldehyde dehydrogenase family protein [Phenylobacterium sp. LH3H17]